MKSIKPYLYGFFILMLCYSPLLLIIPANNYIDETYLEPRIAFAEEMFESHPDDGINGIQYNPHIPQPWDDDYEDFTQDRKKFGALIIGCLALSLLLQYTFIYLINHQKINTT